LLRGCGDASGKHLAHEAMQVGASFYKLVLECSWRLGPNGYTMVGGIEVEKATRQQSVFAYCVDLTEFVCSTPRVACFCLEPTHLAPTPRPTSPPVRRVTSRGT
jgi:hypothetical protein